MSDPIAPARGCVNGCPIAGLAWFGFFMTLAWFVK